MDMVYMLAGSSKYYKLWLSKCSRFKKGEALKGSPRNCAALNTTISTCSNASIPIATPPSSAVLLSVLTVMLMRVEGCPWLALPPIPLLPSFLRLRILSLTIPWTKMLVCLKALSRGWRSQSRTSMWGSKPSTLIMITWKEIWKLLSTLTTLTRLRIAFLWTSRSEGVLRS